MEEETKKTNNIALIIILILIVLALAGYIVYDKVVAPNLTLKNSPIEPGAGDEINISEDSDYFNELLYSFLPRHGSGYFMKNIEEFGDKEISDYIFCYYYDYAFDNHLSNWNGGNYATYNVSKEEIDKLVFKLFGKKEYNIITTNWDKTVEGIKKIDEQTYQLFWGMHTIESPTYETTFNKINSLENEVIVQYVVEYDSLPYSSEIKEGTLTFHLIKNNGNWNVTKLEYNENK